jgi:hypothetical protein
MAEECKKSGVSLTEVRTGSRRGRLPTVKTKIVRGLVENYAVSVAAIARSDIEVREVRQESINKNMTHHSAVQPTVYVRKSESERV